MLRGGPGQGVSDVVHALSRQAGGRTTIWIDAVSDETHGPHARVSRQESLDDPPTPALTRPHGEAVPHPAAGLQPVAEALHLLGDDQAGHGRLVLVDGFHLLSPADAKVVVEWLQQQRFTDTVVVVGVHPIECAPDQGQLLSVIGPTTGIDLPRMGTDQLTAVLSRRHPSCLPQSLAQISRFARGIPALAVEAADHHCIQARTDGHGDPLERSLELAVLRVSVPILARHGAEDFHLGLAAALAAPEGSVGDIATVIDHAEPSRVEALLKQIGLLGGDDDRAATVRSAVLGGTDPEHLQPAAGVALDLLERADAPPERVLELVELLGPQDGDYLGVARRAVEGFLDRGMEDRALDLALQALRRSRCPNVIAWARSVALGLSLSQNWARARKMMLAGGPDDELVREIVASGELSPEFSLDASHAVGLVTEALLAESVSPAQPEPRSPEPLNPEPPHPESLDPETLNPQRLGSEPRIQPSPLPDTACDSALVMHHHVLAGRVLDPRHLRPLLARSGPVRSVELSSLLAGALRGSAAEARLRQMEERLTSSVGTFGVGAHRAALLAATHLCLANHQDALGWCNIATITAGPDELSSKGLGHTIAALAQLREGDLADALTHAETAQQIFGSLHAEHLAAFASFVIAHTRIEGGQEGELPAAPEDRWHPVLQIYGSYVRARHLVATGTVDDGVTQLFRVGRHLEKAGLANPTLVNWRPHLIAVFRGGHKDDYANIVEEDLLKAMRAWHRVNPVSALSRNRVLGCRATELVACESALVATEPESAGEQAELSEAEARVVRLVVQGQSNREVARELYLSKRTIDTHLSNVYRKLGLSSRSELTAHLRDAGTSLPDPLQDQRARGLAPLYG